MIAQSGWSSIDGEVVCQQLGYTSEGTKVFNGSYYGKPNRPVNINNVACTGTENTLMDCKYSEFAFSDKKSLRPLIEVVGVKCNTNGINDGDTNGINDGVISDTPTCTPPYPALMGGVFATLASIITVAIILVVLVLIQVLTYTRFKKCKPNHTNAMLLETNDAYAASRIHTKQTLPPLPTRKNKVHTQNDCGGEDRFYSSVA